MFAPRCLATSIVVITTRHGIVIGADGKFVTKGNPAIPANTKISLLPNKIVIADAGLENLNVPGGSSYSFDSLVEYLRSNASSRTSVTDMVAMTERRLSQVFESFDDTVLKSGVLKAENLPPPGNAVLELYIAGYEHGHPLAYLIELDIDWLALHLKAPVESIVCPNPARTSLCLYWTGGAQHGIVDLVMGVQTKGVQRAVDTIPVEIEALNKDQDLPLSQTVLLGHGLLDIEVEASPETIGYPLTIFAITPSGTRKHTYADSLK